MVFQKVDANISMASKVQDCTNSIADALELLQSCTKPSIWPCLTPFSDATAAVLPSPRDEINNASLRSDEWDDDESVISFDSTDFARGRGRGDKTLEW